MKVCLTGDVFLGGDLIKNDIKNIIQSDVFLDADMRIINLEQPISDNKYLEKKSTLYTDSSSVQLLQDLKISAVNLAHNHIQDKGIEGIVETVSHLEQAKIASFGAGSNISQSKKPYWLTEDIALFGYCQYAKPYLNQVVIASEVTAGANPLQYDNILNDLELIPNDKTAILYFHWGREHVWLPPYENIMLAKKILEHPKVLFIVGMHSHRIQGIIEHNGKRAYMCLGNFLFPNFYMAPPSHLYYPKETPIHVDVTRKYHRVDKITYKKWKLVNRVSLILLFDTKKGNVKHSFVVQDDNVARIMELKGFKLMFFVNFFNLLNYFYKIPAGIYKPLEFMHRKINIFMWRFQIYFFHLKQMGLLKFTKKIILTLKRRYHA